MRGGSGQRSSEGKGGKVKGHQNAEEVDRGQGGPGQRLSEGRRGEQRCMVRIGQRSRGSGQRFEEDRGQQSVVNSCQLLQ